MYEERVRALEEAIANRDRTLGQLRDSLLQADVEYKKVSARWDRVLSVLQGAAHARLKVSTVWKWVHGCGLTSRAKCMPVKVLHK